jgi:prohibitin 2
VLTIVVFVVLVLVAGALFARAFQRVVAIPAGGVRPGSLVGGSVFAVLAFLSLGLVQIEAGHVGVVRQLGAVTGEVMPPGLAWRLPFITSVDDVDTRVRSIRIEGYSAASKEQQDLFMNLTLNYHVDPAEAPTIIQTIGSDFEAKIVQPRLLDIPKSVTDDYPTTVVLNSRDEIRDKATALLRESLAPFGFVVDNIALENFSYSPEYNAAIEAKQVEAQRVETERQKLAQAEIVAQQRVAEARGLAEAQIERARGEAESNRLVAASLTQNILTNRFIEKLAGNIQAILVPSEGGFILDLGDALKPSPAP